MALYGRYPERNFTLCPDGLHRAVCVDVIDLGECDTKFGKKFRVRLVWQIDLNDPASGRRHDVIKSYTNSLHKRANLRADLETWRGRKFSEDEAKRFDLEALIGANAMLHVAHDTGEDGTVYAHVRAIMPPPKDTAKLTPLTYTRHQGQSARFAPATTWPTKPAAKPAAMDPDDPLPSTTARPAAAAASAAGAPDDDIDFAFGANIDLDGLP